MVTMDVRISHAWVLSAHNAVSGYHLVHSSRCINGHCKYEHNFHVSTSSLLRACISHIYLHLKVHALVHEMSVFDMFRFPSNGDVLSNYLVTSLNLKTIYYTTHIFCTRSDGRFMVVLT